MSEPIVHPDHQPKVDTKDSRSKRRTLFTVISALAVVVLLFGGYLIINRGKNIFEKSLAANIALTEGSAMIKRTGTDRWIEAKVNDTLVEGDAIKTANASKAVLLLDNGSAVRLDADSEIVLTDMAASQIMIDQTTGQSYSRVISYDNATYTVACQGVSTKAIGTAFTINSVPAEKTVQVAMLENSAEVNTGKELVTVPEVNKAVINTETQTAELSELTEEEYNQDFIKWNLEQDQGLGVTLKDTTKPTINIASPSNNTETNDSTITIQGAAEDNQSLKKIVINGAIYTSKDANGKGFDPADGSFNVDVSLKDGANTIEAYAYDTFWNKSDAAKITVTKKTSQTATTTGTTSNFYISSISSPANGKIYVKWVANNLSAPNGFKVVWSKDHSNPVYPGDDYVYMSDSGAREATKTDLEAGTYNVRVCVYNGDGGCTQYTANKTVTIEAAAQENYATSVSLSATAIGGGKVDLSWSITGGDAPKGFKVAWSTSANPGYPSPNEGWTYISEPSARSTTISGLTPGATLHFRVGIYHGGSCDPYSNDVTVLVN